jgi:hypothetical protein
MMSAMTIPTIFKANAKPPSPSPNTPDPVLLDMVVVVGGVMCVN